MSRISAARVTKPLRAACWCIIRELRISILIGIHEAWGFSEKYPFAVCLSTENLSKARSISISFTGPSIREKHGVNDTSNGLSTDPPRAGLSFPVISTHHVRENPSRFTGQFRLSNKDTERTLFNVCPTFDIFKIVKLYNREDFLVLKIPLLCFAI